jgi:signal transduction histidine kinase
MKEQSRKMTEICVSDNGIGMDAQKVSGLFQTHLHSSENGTADEKGTGLGLILCKELVERNGGTITAQSEIGKGSRFFVMLNAI